MLLLKLQKGIEYMAITYRKLFHLLLDRNIKKGELQEKAGITASIMARLAKDETVKSDTLGKICDALNCQPGDIMENVSAANQLLAHNVSEAHTNISSGVKHEKHYKPFNEADTHTNNTHTEPRNISNTLDNETLNEKLERLRKEHTAQNPANSKE